jgi:hypothetical protein
MNVVNRHTRTLPTDIESVGAILDSLAGPDDRVWPSQLWPAMRLDRALQVGSSGGHGPIRYFVQSRVPGQEVVFRFLAPRGFHGTHAFSVSASPGGAVVSHTLSMRAAGTGIAAWLLVFRPLHDALIEDALSNIERAATGEAKQVPWSPYVRLLRTLLGRRPRRST